MGSYKAPFLDSSVDDATFLPEVGCDRYSPISVGPKVYVLFFYTLVPNFRPNFVSEVTLNSVGPMLIQNKPSMYERKIIVCHLVV